MLRALKIAKDFESGKRDKSLGARQQRSAARAGRVPASLHNAGLIRGLLQVDSRSIIVLEQVRQDLGTFLPDGIEKFRLQAERLNDRRSNLSGMHLVGHHFAIQRGVRYEKGDMAVVRCKTAVLHVLGAAGGVNHAVIRLHHDVGGAAVLWIAKFARCVAQIGHRATVVRTNQLGRTQYDLAHWIYLRTSCRASSAG